MTELSLRVRAFTNVYKGAVHLGSLDADKARETMDHMRTDKDYRRLFMRLPIHVLGSPRGRANPPTEERDRWTLHPGLQDLADIIAVEAEQAFTASYYPGIPEVECPTSDHVRALMAAMQRELDGEANSRTRVAQQLPELPWERQVALAERRRYWFLQFGIDRRRWERGVWNVWRVKDIPLPEEVTQRRF